MAIFNVLGVMVLVNMIASVANGLSINYYIMTCPFADSIIKNTVNWALYSDPTLAAALVRMHFHDCFIEGCEASILIDSTKNNTAEKDSPANLSLRGYEIIDAAKEELEKHCPGVVSCADILAMAAREAILFTGGPLYGILNGRKDGRSSNIVNTIKLPAQTLNSSELIAAFGQLGFTAREMVALSGAHTLGMARCTSFKNRLKSVDPNMDPQFAKTLLNTCSKGDKAGQPLDSTRNTFDNDYFNQLRKNSGVLFSDQALFVGPETRDIVNEYAINIATFFYDFQRAMVKMGTLDVKEGSEGEVRNNCRRIN